MRKNVASWRCLNPRGKDEKCYSDIYIDLGDGMNSKNILISTVLYGEYKQRTSHSLSKRNREG